MHLKMQLLNVSTMNNMLKRISYVLLLCLTITLMGGCQPGSTGDKQNNNTPTNAPELTEIVDYAGAVTFDKMSGRVSCEVTVKTFVDGDTVHFNVPTSVMPNGVLKARFLAVNTPESTGKIEEWGKKASKFTKETLSKATSIIIESDTASWNADSTGDRYLVWIWYKTADSATYRNLNIEILQEGLAIANASSNNSYGDTCMKAINQAKAQKLHVYSGQKDPDFYYGDSVELTIKELRANPEAYNNMKVAFNGIVTVNNGNNSVYVEEYDPENDMYYGFAIYYGFNLSGTGLEILNIGNEVRIVGSLQYYETGGTWQVADLSYRIMKPDDPNNIQKLSEGHKPSYVLTTPEQFLSGTVDILVNEEMKTYKYAEMALNTTIRMENLKVVDVYTTQNEESSSNGAMTLTCEANGYTISVRTGVLYDDNGNLITESAYMGKTIDVNGVIDYFDGGYQIKVFSDENITVK